MEILDFKKKIIIIIQDDFQIRLIFIKKLLQNISTFCILQKYVDYEKDFCHQLGIKSSKWYKECFIFLLFCGKISFKNIFDFKTC